MITTIIEKEKEKSKLDTPVKASVFEFSVQKEMTQQALAVIIEKELWQDWTIVPTATID